MNTSTFYEVKSDHNGVAAGTIVQDTGYVQTFVNSDEWNYWVQYTIDGQLHRAWIPKDKLAQVAKPDTWITIDSEAS